MPDKLNVIFAGTPEIAAKVLFALQKYCHLKLIITRKDALNKRGNKLQPSPVKQFAISNLSADIPILEDPTPEEVEKLLGEQQINIDIGIVVAYGKIFESKMLNIPKDGWINLHYSILPKYRGASPVQSAILNGESETGVSFFKLREGLDDGPVIAQKMVKINEDITSGELLDQLTDEGIDILPNLMQKLSGGEVKFSEQEGHNILPENEKYAKKLLKSDAKIDWTLNVCETAHILKNFINAYSPNPGAWFEYFNEKKQCIMRVVAIKATLEDGLVKLIRVKPAGKNEMSWDDFLRGNSGYIITNNNNE